jgi:hypothetical protein
MKLLALLLLPILGFSQQGYKMDLVVSRVDVTSTTRISARTERITLVLYRDSLTLTTPLEQLSFSKTKRTEVFKTKNKQLYQIFMVISDEGFMIVITPIKPFLNKPLYAINLTSI